MRKLLSLIVMSLIILGGCANARCIYDSRGKLIYDDTIRGRQRAKLQAEQQAKIQAAAAAKVNIETIEEANEPVKKSNYIQSKNGTTRELPETKLKSNYIQSLDNLK